MFLTYKLRYSIYIFFYLKTIPFCEFKTAWNSGVKLREADVLSPKAKTTAELIKHNVTQQVHRNA